MVSTVLTCRDCGSENLIRHGHTENGHPRFRCRACGVTFSDSPERGHTQEFKERVLAAYHERSSMRGIARVFKISRNTLTKWLKEKGGN